MIVDNASVTLEQAVLTAPFDVETLTHTVAVPCLSFSIDIIMDGHSDCVAVIQGGGSNRKFTTSNTDTITVAVSPINQPEPYIQYSFTVASG